MGPNKVGLLLNTSVINRLVILRRPFPEFIYNYVQVYNIIWLNRQNKHFRCYYFNVELLFFTGSGAIRDTGTRGSVFPHFYTEHNMLHFHKLWTRYALSSGAAFEGLVYPLKPAGSSGTPHIKNRHLYNLHRPSHRFQNDLLLHKQLFSYRHIRRDFAGVVWKNGWE